MRRRTLYGLAAATALSAAAIANLPATAQDAAMEKTIDVISADGNSLGTVKLTQVPTGVLIQTDLSGLAAGSHAFHFHTTGACEPPFDSAGGHFNPTNAEHGLTNPNGPHAGDMPNVMVAADGSLKVEVINTMVTLSEGEKSLLDSDGSALMLHADHDDHASDPAGNAGARMACGVIAN